MAESVDNIREVVRILTSQISIGWDYFVVAKFIREAYDKDEVMGTHEILTHAYASYWDAAILAVTKVLDKQKDSTELP